MSYILDALQKSAADAQPALPRNDFPGTASKTSRTQGGLPLPWKLAIGAVLLANVALLYLWRTDRVEKSLLAQTDSGANYAPTSPKPAPAANPPGTSRKITLPGIVSPLDLQPPSAASNESISSGSLSAGTASSGTGRTFKPNGRPITIAGEPELESQDYGLSPKQTVQSPGPSTNRIIPKPETSLPPTAQAQSASALSALSDGARDALKVLSFSFHIYGAESDLRSLGVNGQRVTEGRSITTGNGKVFRIVEITDNGAIIDFEHNGESVSVAIPVMEDWKDS